MDGYAVMELPCREQNPLKRALLLVAGILVALVYAAAVVAAFCFPFALIFSAFN